MDQFKKIDKNNVGKVTKQEFIDGILRSSNFDLFNLILKN